MEKLENLKKKLVYRSSYRGTKEMDLLLSSFVKFYINKLTAKDLYELEKFLEISDEDISNFYYNNVSTQTLKKNIFSELLKKFKIS